MVEDVMDKLIAEARAGRGLWVGLHLFRSTPDGAHTKLSVSAEYPQITDPHSTLRHLGKGSRAPILVPAALQAALTVSQTIRSFTSRVDGCARFRGSEREGDPVVFLLGSTTFRTVRQIFDARMSELGHNLGHDYFDYKPHLTVTRVPRGVTLEVTTPPELHLEFRHVSVVCGDHRTYFPLKD